MAEPVTAFFEALQGRHEPLLEKVTATMRVDLVDEGRTERWHIAVSKGDLAVSKRNAPADCVMYADRALFGRVAAGRQNVVAAVLRGAIGIEGNPELFVLFQRLFPSPKAGRR